jgi:beta-1,4-mannosyltransferase
MEACEPPVSREWLMDKLPWLFYPDFRGSNPYQDLLARALSCDAKVRTGTITDALEAAATAPTVFHLHWEDTIYAGASNECDASTITEVFLFELAVFRNLGGRVVWTVHNATPHEDAFPTVSAGLRRALAEQADVVHVHGRIAYELVRTAGATDERILTVPHPNIAPAYPDDINDQDARRYFSLGSDDTVFAFLGSMRTYKGVDMLLRAFSQVHRLQPMAQLILGGRQARSLEGRYLMPSWGVRLIPRFVDDGIVQYVMHAADYIVLPYDRILTSGVVALALGFGRPVIVPDLPTLLEVVQQGRESLVFRAEQQDDLARVMLEACALGLEARRGLQERARHTGGSTTFRDLATALVRRVHQVNCIAVTRPRICA